MKKKTSAKRKAPKTKKASKAKAHLAVAKAAKSAGKEKLKITNLKTTDAERKALKIRAAKFAKGNLSAWLRHAGLKYTPKRGERISVAP